jgi:acyl-CoA reductase-like NAD-dependent aldehyde dehydrogenase
MVIAREEIFGPVLVIIGYDDIEDAIAIANDSPFGLGGYVSGEDAEACRNVARKLRTGAIWVNGGFGFHAWEGGTGNYDCEPLTRRFGPSGESFGIRAQFAINEGWRLTL